VHCVVLGVAGDIVRHGGGTATQYWVVRDERGAVAGAALFGAARNLALSRMTGYAVQALAAQLRRGQVELTGAGGPADETALFASLWAGNEVEAQLDHTEHVWELGRVTASTASRGLLSVAGWADLEELAAWTPEAATAFGLTAEEWDEEVGTAVERGQLYLWRDSGLVAMAMIRGETPTGLRVSGVFTPAVAQRLGYATSLVSAVSRAALDSGRQRVFLFTDTRNATAEGIYARIGYQQVGMAKRYRFVPPGNEIG